MTKEQEIDIREYIEDKVEKIEKTHVSQRAWLISINVTIIIAFSVFGYAEAVKTQKNSDKIEHVQEQVTNTLPANLLIDVHNTYEMEFWAIASVVEGDTATLTKVMQEFRSYRWALLSKYVHKDVGRGNDGEFNSWLEPGLLPFEDKVER